PKPAETPDRSQAYYHLALATYYEEEAVEQGRPEYATFAVEEYKKALNSDPASPQLNTGLASLYFRTGKTREAEATARELLKTAPNDLEAHRLLGRIYLHQLGEGQSVVSSASPAGNTLDQAIAEYEKIVALDPRSTEERMVLGQLYTVKHDQKKAEEQFKIARAMEPDSEEVVLSLARLYAENGDLAQAARIIENVAVNDRTPKMEYALGAAYDQLKRPKDAIAAYQRAADMAPGDLRTLGSLAQALLADNQLDSALKAYRELSDADPEDAGALIHITEILRRQGKYEEALTTVRKVGRHSGDTLEIGYKLEAGYNEGLLLDVLGRFDEAVQVYERMVELTAHANGAYTSEEKNNRGIFLERVGALYEEQNKTDQAIAVFQKMIELGGETALNGYRGQIGAYTQAHQLDKAVETARKAVEANPKDRDLKLILASELADAGKTDEGLAMARSLLANNDDDRPVWLALGQMEVRARRWKDAEDAFNRAGALTTKKEDRVYLCFLRGEWAERQKHLEPAEQFFRQALDLDPDNAMTLNYLGYMLADKGARLPEALKMIRKAVELEPMNGAFLDSLGWAYFKMGEYELAEENLRQAVDRDRSDPTVHDHLGDLYEKTGRIRLAVTQWELSVAEFARSAPADVDPAEQAKVQHKLETAKVKLAKQESATGQAKPE
ncbi:MAG: tetratricopeptide repeat protein, partial [Terracidiphilus sp.]